MLVADLEELGTKDASETCSKRLNAKEVIFPKDKGKFVFIDDAARNVTILHLHHVYTARNCLDQSVCLGHFICAPVTDHDLDCCLAQGRLRNKHVCMHPST